MWAFEGIPWIGMVVKERAVTGDENRAEQGQDCFAFFLLFFCAIWHLSSLTRGSNPCPLRCEHEIPTWWTGREVPRLWWSSCSARVLNSWVAERDWVIYKGDLCFKQSGRSVQYVRRTTREAERQARSCNNNLEEIFLGTLSPSLKLAISASCLSSHLLPHLLICHSQLADPLLSFRESELLDLKLCWVIPPPKPDWFHLCPESQLSGLTQRTYLKLQAPSLPAFAIPLLFMASFPPALTPAWCWCVRQAAVGSERNTESRFMEKKELHGFYV